MHWMAYQIDTTNKTHFHFLPYQSILFVNLDFCTVWNKHLARKNSSYTVERDPSIQKSYLSKNDVNATVPITSTYEEEKSNKCSPCGYACSDPASMRTHLKSHKGEESKKCNQCDYASSRADVLRAHLKTRTGEKLNICNQFQCNYAPSQASNLKKHLKTHGRSH